MRQQLQSRSAANPAHAADRPDRPKFLVGVVFLRRAVETKVCAGGEMIACC
jgi:hypothetical protein